MVVDLLHWNMMPRAQATGRTQTDDQTETEFNRWKALQKATDKKRADLIADIVGHPKGLISVQELEYMNPDRSDHSIRRDLGELQDVGVVNMREFEEDYLRDYPRQFFEITAEAREMFDDNGLFPEDAWKRQYQSVKKTPKIREIEEMPRPDQ